MRKKLVVVIMIMLLCANMLPFNVFASESTEIVYSGRDGDLDWSIDSNGHLEIVGDGDLAYTCSQYGTNCPGWFEYRTQIKTADVEVVNITNMSSFFRECTVLREINFMGSDTSNVQDMSQMFFACASLTSNFDGLNTSCVRNMSEMFYSCFSLTELDLSKFDTSNVTNMYNMFCECIELTKLELGSFNTSNVTNMEGMFTNCSGLSEIDLSSFDTSCATGMSGMFSGCSGLSEIDLSSFDTSCATGMSSMFNGCSGLSEIDVSKFDTSKVTNTAYMFAGCSGLSEIDMSSFDTSSVTNMAGMFSDCSGLSEIDMSKFDTSKVTDMAGMFSDCSGLSEIDMSSFDTSSVTNMYAMFSGCSGLSRIDLSSFDTSSVTDMRTMFSGCSELTKLDVSNFNTSSVTDMRAMFSGCSELTKLDVSNFNTSNVTQMGRMNDEQQGMFANCTSLQEVDIRNFDVSKVRDAAYMFYNCGQLKELDLSGFDMHVTYSHEGMWEGLTSLVHLKTPKNFAYTPALPTGIGKKWTDNAGNVYTSFPLKSSESVELYCGLWPGDMESISGYSISLNGDVAVNYYIDLSDEVIADTTAYMQFTMPNGDVSKVMVSDAKVDATSGNYIFPCDVSAAEMTDEIKAQIITTVGETQEYTYTVKTYADYILAHTDVAEYAEAAPLVKAMLNYGGYSQKQFNHNLTALANSGLYDEATDPVLTENVTIADTYIFTAPKKDVGLKYYGSSLLLNSKTTVRHYFTITGEETFADVKANYTFTLADGTVLTPKMNSGMVCVDIVDIKAAELDNMFTLSVTNTTTSDTFDVVYSPMSYAKYILEYSVSGEKLVNVIKAMYLYNVAANAYFD